MACAAKGAATTDEAAPNAAEEQPSRPHKRQKQSRNEAWKDLYALPEPGQALGTPDSLGTDTDTGPTDLPNEQEGNTTSSASTTARHSPLRKGTRKGAQAAPAVINSGDQPRANGGAHDDDIGPAAGAAAVARMGIHVGVVDSDASDADERMLLDFSVHSEGPEREKALLYIRSRIDKQLRASDDIRQLKVMEVAGLWTMDIYPETGKPLMDICVMH